MILKCRKEVPAEGLVPIQHVTGSMGSLFMHCGKCLRTEQASLQTGMDREGTDNNQSRVFHMSISSIPLPCSAPQSDERERWPGTTYSVSILNRVTPSNILPSPTTHSSIPVLPQARAWKTSQDGPTLNQAVLKEINPAYSLEGLMLKLQHFGHLMRRADSLWKDPDAGEDWGKKDKGVTEDKMVGWHHEINGHESEQTPGVGDEQESLVRCSLWGRKESDTTQQLNNHHHHILISLVLK